MTMAEEEEKYKMYKGSNTCKQELKEKKKLN